MHIYIYDNYLGEKKYQSLLAQIETRITDLGLNGKIIRMGVMNSIYDAIDNEIKKGAKTIIAVGNDNLLNKVINSVIKINSNYKNNNIPIGFIPIGKDNNKLAQFLGININKDACDILSARRIKRLNLGKVNDFYFLFNLFITTKDTIINIDKKFSLEINKEGIVKITNSPLIQTLSENNIDVKNSALKLIIQTSNNLFNKTKSNTSIFSFENLTIFNKNNSITIDNSIQVNTPADISLSKETINLIVGKNRFF